jgi:hypothetical protein
LNQIATNIDSPFLLINKSNIVNQGGLAPTILFAVVARIIFIVITTITFSFSLITYKRYPSKKSLLITIGFALFFVHGLISIPELFIHVYDVDFTDSLHLLIDAVAVLFLLLGTLKEHN